MNSNIKVNDEGQKTWQETIEDQRHTISLLREALSEYELLLDAQDSLTTVQGRHRFKKYIRDTYDWRNQ